MFYIFSLFKAAIKPGLILGTSLIMAFDSHQSPPEYLTEQQLAELAQSITVRVFASNQSGISGGSGVLISNNGQKYTVLTNHHVVKKSDRDYQIQTPDGQYYQAKVVTSFISDDDDVSILTFNSQGKSYQTAPLNQSLNTTEQVPVIAGGFPYGDNFIQSKEFRFSTGQINKILDQPLIGGYQIGYTNLVLIGMSGGPLLNYQGELIGINGMSKYPLFGNPYVFKDGSTVSDEEWNNMSELSWAISLNRIMETINP